MYTHYLAQSRYGANCDTIDSSATAYSIHESRLPYAQLPHTIWVQETEPFSGDLEEMPFTSQPGSCASLECPGSRNNQGEKCLMHLTAYQVVGNAQGVEMPSCQIQTMTRVDYRVPSLPECLMALGLRECPGWREPIELECPGLSQFQF